ncbi:MAG: ATP-binding cassette domain-containing protein [Flavobacteriales bacterium]|nr:ATP-binding cassette domain-containing protein [Flavobacteriales bacterium]
MIEIKNIKKSFGDIEVLKGITTTFEEGKTNLIIGQSGSGKTVLLKTLLGIFEPTEGDIFYNKKSTKGFTASQKQDLRSDIGTVFQGSALFDYMTVEENIRFPLDMFSNYSKSEKEDRVNNVINRVNLTNANKKYPSEISGGMQKRVAIARSIVNNPKYLFCDEPNSGLDPQTAILIDQLIHEITIEYNTTTIINTHDMNSVMEIGEKILFLKNGYKEWEGDKTKILRAENEAVINFVYSSELYKKLRKALLAQN